MFALKLIAKKLFQQMSEHPEWANLMTAARKQFQLLKDFNPHAKSEV